MTNTEIANNYWLPIECGAMSTGSEKYNLNAMDIAFIREKLKELDAYEDLMNKEPEDPNIIKVDEVTDIPKEIKKRKKGGHMTKDGHYPPRVEPTDKAERRRDMDDVNDALLDGKDN